VRTPDGEQHFFFVGGGALEVQPTKVTVLADTALRARDIDEAAALAASSAPRKRSGTRPGTSRLPKRRPSWHARWPS